MRPHLITYPELMALSADERTKYFTELNSELEEAIQKSEENMKKIEEAKAILMKDQSCE